MEANIALPAALIGDPVRAGILTVLFDGRAQPATALAYAARVSAQCASNHLAKLVDGGLLTVEREGRHRYYRLSTPQVATALEALSCLAPPVRALDAPLTAQGRTLRFARCCYDHLAGQLGVAVTARLEDRGYVTVVDRDSKLYALSAEGRRWFAGLGIDVDSLKPTRMGLARRCLDWTERRHHLAGPLGAALLARLLALGWLCRDRRTRAVRTTPAGAAGFSQLDVDVHDLLCAAATHRPTPAQRASIR
jgi:DNA-binding transcriptional ArsR family regulator